jgi:triacylglycerol lipase
MSAPFDKFNPNTTRWDANNALALAQAAKLAYSNQKTVRGTLTDWGFTATAPRFRFVNNKETDTQGFVVGNEQMIIVSFRGTQPTDVHDWLTDMEALLHPFPVGMVHWGFYDALNSVWADVQKAISDVLDQFPNQGPSLWFTGHSLGAALATIAVARCLFEQPHTPVNGLYTFGSPRTGNFIYGREFDSEFGDKTFRFVNDRDVVTRVPPRVLFYSHVGRTLFFDQQHVLQNDDHWWNRFLREVEIDWESLEDLPQVIEEHAIDLYIANMSKYIEDVASGKRESLTW